MNDSIEITIGSGETRSFEAGAVMVPADHDDPGQGALTLRFVRLRSPYPERTPVVFLSGGPGDSGIHWLRHTPFQQVFERVAQSRDVILLDQRGTGRSEGDTRCERPDFRAVWLEDTNTALAMLADQARRTLARPDAPRPAWYTPWQSARDLACVADALGRDRIQLWGYSYGTHLAQAALKAIPERIERVVLCGFEGPDQTYKLPSRIQAQVVERLAHLAARQGVCADLAAQMARVHAQLAERPVAIPLADGMTASVGTFGVQWLAGSWIGVSNRFVRLPALYAALERGDGDAAMGAFQGFIKMLVARPAVFYLKDAASGATVPRLARIAQEAPACLLGDACNFPFPAIGAAWQQEDLGDTFRLPLVSAHPIFILTGSLDGFTPTENALESLPSLPNAVHAPIENAAHNDLLASPEAVEDIVRFLNGETPLATRYTIPEPRMVR